MKTFSGSLYFILPLHKLSVLAKGVLRFPKNMKIILSSRFYFQKNFYLYTSLACILPKLQIDLDLIPSIKSLLTLSILFFLQVIIIFFNEKTFYFKYSSVYLSIPNSQSIPPPHPSPLVTISSFSKFVSMFLFRR